MAQAYAAPAAGRKNFQTNDGVKLSFLETGAAKQNGLTIALITGWLMPAEIWRRQLDSFGQRYHTLALDPRGQGESEVPSNGYTAERRATDIKEFLDSYSNTLLVGWSLGAIEALQYIHMFGAQRLAGLVLVDSSVGEEPAPKEDGSFLKALRA